MAKAWEPGELVDSVKHTVNQFTPEGRMRNACHALLECVTDEGLDEVFGRLCEMVKYERRYREVAPVVETSDFGGDPQAEELAAFERELPELLNDGLEGQFAVIVGNRVIDVYERFTDAVINAERKGHKRGTYLVKQIVREEVTT